MNFSVESRPPSSQLSLTFKSLGISGRGWVGRGLSCRKCLAAITTAPFIFEILLSFVDFWNCAWVGGGGFGFLQIIDWKTLTVWPYLIWLNLQYTRNIREKLSLCVFEQKLRVGKNSEKIKEISVVDRIWNNVFSILLSYTACINVSL